METSTFRKSIIITGFPYAFPYYGRVFDFLKNKNDVVLLLPCLWEAKKGKVRVSLQIRPDIMTEGVAAVSYGGSGLKGLLKGWMPGMALKILYFRLRFKSRVLYSCSEPHLLSTLWNGLFAKLFGLKHVIFTWQNIPPEKRMRGLKLFLSNSIVRVNLFLADGIICGNRKAVQIIQAFSKSYNVLHCPISGVDTDKFKPRGSSYTSHGLSEKVILFYGALDDRKGVKYLIEAFHQILSKIDAKLIIIGTGPEKERLESQAYSLGLKDKVVFTDWLPNDQLPSLLQNSDVFAYPSVPRGGWEEQFGYAMVEASACAIPVVATKTGSIDEVVLDGATGILVEPSNSHHLAIALERLLNDGELRKKMGDAGREFVIMHYDHKIIANKIYDFLSTL